MSVTERLVYENGCFQGFIVTCPQQADQKFWSLVYLRNTEGKKVLENTFIFAHSLFKNGKSCRVDNIGN
jgi:hypothetical protein